MLIARIIGGGLGAALGEELLGGRGARLALPGRGDLATDPVEQVGLALHHHPARPPHAGLGATPSWARLRDPGLTVAALAAALHTSVSTLHRAFATEPYSIAEWIWAERLDAVRAEICDPALRHRTISDLAFGWGFSDASHFSRAFRARYGCTASELRRG